MPAMVLKRLAQAVVVALVVVLLSFTLIHITPGDPVSNTLGTRATPQLVAELRAEAGLDRPLVEQALDSLWAAMRGDLGVSIAQPGRRVSDLVLPALGVTMPIVGLTIVFSLFAGSAAALLAVLSRRRTVQTATDTVATVLLCLPPFFFGLLLILLAAIWLGIAPAGGWAGSWPDNFRYVWLPSLALSAYLGPLVYRAVEASAEEVLRSDYVDAATSRGIGPLRLALRHVLPNSMLPTITLIGLNLGTLIGGAAVIETVFDLPGLGQQIVTAVTQRDYPVIQGAALVTGVIVVAGNLVADLLYTVIDPRTRVSR